MKTLKEFMEEVAKSDELVSELETAKDMKAIMAFFRKHDCETTPEEFTEYAKTHKDREELKEEDLEKVSGGGLFSIFGGKKRNVKVLCFRFTVGSEEEERPVHMRSRDCSECNVSKR